ncbi:hypothetical protein BJ944DRAFT_80037 [Cunninghamella echinulata]|nr:hypothetical protein BJ944DRAFT_80037 [Cunninghamella echinulata]
MQTLSYSHHLELLKIPWIILKGKTNDVYYIKAHYDDTEYKILVTDLKYVWYEHGNSILIMRRAENYRMEIETKEQIKTLICSLRNCFEQSKNCFPTLIENKLVIEYNESMKGFTSLSWSFHCLPLEITMDSKNENEFLDGPTVLYMHFILPMLMVTQSESMKRSSND